MNFRDAMAFPGAGTDSPESAAYAILGASLDATNTFRPGARFGPERIRRFARVFEDYDRPSGTSFQAGNVTDLGTLRANGSIAAYIEFLTGTITDLLEAETIPLILGGEHTLTIAPIRAMEPGTLIILDAHLDLRETYADQRYSHATVANHAREQGWSVTILGARSGSEAEWDRVDEDDAIEVVEPEAIEQWSPAQPDGPCWLSVDIDVVDPAFAPGVGTPHPGGISGRKCIELVRAIAPSVDGADVVEVNDRDDGQAPTLAARVVRTIVHEHTAHNQ